MSERLRAVFLLGPTASGKTEIAMRLCDRFDAEIISVDSVQVYRQLDIGSAKIRDALRERYPHHLIDILDPAETYSAARFCADALELARAINARGKLPILVGGTMFYFHAFEHGLDALPSSDAAVRAELDALCEREGVAFLYERLRRVDRRSADRIQPQDTQRIKRALEVSRVCGEPMSALQAKNRAPAPPMRLLKIAFDWRDRASLHARIQRRFLDMLNAGLSDEVGGLMLRGDLSDDSVSMRAAGYRQMWRHLSGRLSWDEMIEAGLSSHRQLAKRQLTWMRSMTDLRRYYVDEQSTEAIAAAAGERISELCAL